MEVELGVLLVRRHARGIGLTPAGEMLKKKAELILGMLGTLRDEIRAASDEPSGRVAFGVPASMSGLLTGSVVQSFHESYPAVKLQIRDGTSGQLRSALLGRELDFAVLTAPVSEPQLLVRPLMTEPLMLVGPATASFAKCRQISLKEVAGFPLILPVKPNATRTLIETAFEREGCMPEIVLETDVAPIAEFISRGLGYAVLPASSISSQALVTKSMVHVAIKDLQMTRLLAMPAGVAMSLATLKLSHMLCEMTKSLIASKQLKGHYLGP